MALIACRECGNQVSDQAPTCPKCGAPIAAVPAPQVRVVQASQPKKKGMGCAGLIGIGVIVVIVLSAIGSQSQKAETQKNVNAAPELSVTAKEIIGAYEANEVAADQKYKGKIVQVSGIADSIGKDLLDDPYVTVGTGKDFELRQVQCFVEKSGESALASLRPKQKVTVKGKVKGLFGNIGLSDCVVVP